MVAFAHTSGRADNGPRGQAAAEGNEGLFAEAAPYLVEGVFVVEVAVDGISFALDLCIIQV